MTRSSAPRFRRALTLLAALAVGACAVRPAPAPDPGIEMPAVWTTAPDAPDPAAPTPPAWWRSFADPQLDALIGEALAANRNLESAAARLDAAVAEARIAGAELAPQMAGDLTTSRRRQNFIGLPIPGAGGVLSSTSGTVGVNLNVSWEADLWGRIRAGRAAARAGVEGARAELAGAELSIAGQTAKAWFGVLEATRQVELAEETLANRRLNHQRIRRRYERGLRSALDLRLAASSEASAAALLALRERQADGARRQLELLLFRYPAAALAAELPAPALPAPPPAPPVGVPAELLTRRPDLLTAERRLAAAGFSVARARAALYPQLRLTGSAGRLSEEVSDLLDSDFSVWSLAEGLLQPIFQGGRLRGGVELAEARHRETAAAYAQALLRALAEVESALAAEGFLADQERAAAEGAEQAVAAQRLAENRYRSGLADYLAVLEAQTGALTAQSQLLEVRRRRLETRVDLHLALGGGFEHDATAPSPEPTTPAAATATPEETS